MESDSVKETKKHIKRVKELLSTICTKLRIRGDKHDASKLKDPEVTIFEEYTSKLKDTEYNSKEYKQFLQEMKPALDHHYKNNSHHPEHYKNGINGMSLIDIFEMLADWRAATERNKNGDIKKSIEMNTDRFKIDDQLKQILLNTVKELHW